MLKYSFRRFATETTKQAIQMFQKGTNLPGIGRVLLIGSSKGGVGKSTVAVNTALALSEANNRVAIFDGNIFSPSIPHFFSTAENPLVQTTEKKFFPISGYGVETLSVGNGLGIEPLVLQGQVIPELVRKLIMDTDWPELDYLIIDSPPGTGDVLFAINDTIPINGAIIVTGPSDIDQAENIRTVDAFSRCHIPIIGVVKNFSGFTCSKKNKKISLFNEGNIDVAKSFKYETLATIPFDPLLPLSVERGYPIMLSAPNSVAAANFRQIAMRVLSLVPKKTEEEFRKDYEIAEMKKQRDKEIDSMTPEEAMETYKKLVDEENRKNRK